jgi:quinol monooxygenase YgiN
VVIITIEMDVCPLKTKEFLQTMLVITQQIRMENGCIACDFLKDLGEENKYRIVGKWKGKDALNNHLQSEEFRVMRGAMCLLANKLDILFYVVTSQQALNPLQKKPLQEQRNTLDA